MPLTQGSDTQLGSSTLDSGGATALSGGSALTDLCDILKNTGPADGIGGFGDNWVAVATDVPCSVAVKTPSVDRTEGEKITAVGVYEFMLPSDTVITPANRLRFQGYVFVLQDRAIPIPNQATILVRARLIE
jgi:hypothetical protein